MDLSATRITTQLLFDKPGSELQARESVTSSLTSLRTNLNVWSTRLGFLTCDSQHEWMALRE